MFEELVKKFAALACKEVLTKQELLEAREIMLRLKKDGMSNQEISNLSGGKWSESTVKGYTKGVKAKEPALWHDMTTLLSNLISMGISLEDVDTAINLIEDLQSRKVGLDDVIEFLLASDAASVDVTTLIQQCKQMKESSLSVKSTAEMLDLKKEMEENGLSLDVLPALVKLAQNYGHPEQVLESVSSYGSLVDLQNKVEEVQKSLEDIKIKQNHAEAKLKQTQKTLAELSEPLSAYEKVLKLGFDEMGLRDLAALTDKYGGHKAVFKSLKTFASYSEIKNQVAKAKSELNKLELDISKLNTNYGHLTTAVNMCQTLISKYKFGLDAIATIFSVASKYGEPLAVLKSVEAQGKLELIQQELNGLEGKVAERKKLLVELEGKHEEALEHLESLNQMALKVGAAVAGVKSQVSNSQDVKKLLNFITNPASASYKEHGPIVLTVATCLRKWVASNEQNFESAYNIKKAFDNLITELGGS
jgi:predicted nuclease with TOPRIM domain